MAAHHIGVTLRMLGVYGPATVEANVDAKVDAVIRAVRALFPLAGRATTERETMPKCQVQATAASGRALRDLHLRPFEREDRALLAPGPRPAALLLDLAGLRPFADVVRGCLLAQASTPTRRDPTKVKLTFANWASRDGYPGR